MWEIVDNMISFTIVFDTILESARQAQVWVDDILLSKYSKISTILLMLIVITLVHSIPKIINYLMSNTILTVVLNIGEFIPFINILIERYMRSQHLMIWDKVGGMLYDESKPLHEILPKMGMDTKEVKAEVEESFKSQYDSYASGMHSGTIYHHEEKAINEWIEHSMREFLDSNPFNADVFISTSQLSSDICNLAKRLFNGDQDTYAITTWGGTESIASAIAAYKFWAKNRKRHN